MYNAKSIVIQLTIALVLLLIGTGSGWWFATHQLSQENQTMLAPTELINESQRRVLYWYDPMMPQQHFEHAGKSPFMDMELMPKYADEQAAAGVQIDPLLAENMGMRLVTVKRQPLSRQIEVSGLLAFNDRDVAVVQTLSNGIVKRVWSLASGDIVQAGQPLAEILQPEWVAAQHEFLAVQTMNDASLLTAAHERLLLLGMPESVIQQLQRSGVVQLNYTIKAPISGVIQSLELRNGMSVTNGQTVARINGLSSVWLEAAVPEAQADVLHVRDTAEIRLTSFPERSLVGKIAAILPMLNESSRSVRVRIELKNPQQQFRPGQTAQIKLSSNGGGAALFVPTEALIRTGKRTLVMLAVQAGRYLPREITIGHEWGDKTAVIAGLEEGENIVASGQFLIDSAASLNGIEAQKLPIQSIPMEAK
ncbi:efflux RND transporter periplasmic adaptor subunit [Methylomonas sp. AM2-LC]|uniref:efflux RND transporter periplasmic adaptor subunit n=1 Tax=Methylomonas sp. AM2-LC TaxID=3153301 RepID=UPI003263DABD